MFQSPFPRSSLIQPEHYFWPYSFYFDFFICFRTLLLAHPFCLFSPNILIFASVLFSTVLSLWMFSNRLLPHQVTPLTSLLSYLPFPRHLLLDSFEAYIVLGTERVSYSSRTSLILLLVQFGIISSTTKCVLVLDIQSMSFSSVFNACVGSRFMIHIMLMDDSYRLCFISAK